MLIPLFPRDFSQYWRDVAKAMPQECAKNIGIAILSVDKTVETKDAVGQHQLRDMLGLQKIFHFDDVAFVRMSSSYLVTRLRFLMFLPSTSFVINQDSEYADE